MKGKRRPLYAGRYHSKNRRLPNRVRRQTLRERFLEIVDEIKTGRPGNRFTRYWQRRQQKREEHPLKKTLWLIIGIILIIVGMALGPTPIVPGFLIAIPGLAIVAGRMRWVAKALDKAEIVLRDFASRLRFD